MSINEQKELVTYLTKISADLETFRIRVSSLKKTRKFKAFASLLQIARARSLASLDYAKAGGDMSVLVQQSIYDPIITWMSSELDD